MVADRADHLGRMSSFITDYI